MRNGGLIMVTTDNKYTLEQMKALQGAFDYFNATLFSSTLPQCILTLNIVCGDCKVVMPASQN